MSPTKKIRPVRPGAARKKASGPADSERAWGPAQLKLVCPIVGGIALIAVIATILYVRGKK